MSEFYSAVLALASPTALAFLMLGTSLGIIVGAIPGLTGAMLIALSLPLTFSMQADHALILLVSMYVGSVSGGLISATLLRIPGTPASMMTTYDGFPMAKNGNAHRALGLGIVASLCGGVVGWSFLLMLSAPLAKLSLGFGPFDFFALVLMAMVLIAAASGKSLSRGLLAGALGILATMPGTDSTGQPRWTLGMNQLDDGFKLLPVLIGLFAINQVLSQLLFPAESTEHVTIARSSILSDFKSYAKHWVNLIRSSLIGVFVGILPGIGANIGSVVAYTVAKATSKSPETFGQGSEEGIVASEAANNATVGGALIPLVAMGIPGSVIDAILLGALTIHGLQPGPMLMEQNPQSVWIIIGTMLAANIFMFVFMLATVRWLAHLRSIPAALLTPIILTMCVVGSFALANRMFDVWIMLAFGIVGFTMDRMKIPVAPFVIGFVLAPIAEEHLTEGLMNSGGSWLPLVTRPISLFLVVASSITFLFTLIRRRQASA